MIRNPDGTPYSVKGSVQQFDPASNDLCLFNQWDAQIIQMGGSPIFYHEIFIQKGTIDPIYREDRGKIFANDGVQLWCFYEPVTSDNYQDQFGIDSPTEMRFEFNYKAVLDTIKHPPKIGSLLYTPHKREWWNIIQRNDGEFKLWGQMRLELICQKFQDDIITDAGRVIHAAPNFSPNPERSKDCGGKI